MFSVEDYEWDADLPSPAFVVDLDRVRENCEGMRKLAQENGVSLRPHVKTHKTVEGAFLQFEGLAERKIVTSTLREAQHFADAGIQDILYGVPFEPSKFASVLSLHRQILHFHVMVDSLESFEALSRQITALPDADWPRKLGIYIAVDGLSHLEIFVVLPPFFFFSLFVFIFSHRWRLFILFSPSTHQLGIIAKASIRSLVARWIWPRTFPPSFEAFVAFSFPHGHPSHSIFSCFHHTQSTRSPVGYLQPQRRQLQPTGTLDQHRVERARHYVAICNSLARERYQGASRLSWRHTVVKVRHLMEASSCRCAAHYH